VTRIHWGPVITGAFLTVATGVVLGLFGTAFGLGNLRVLSGIWLILTPLVAAFIGAWVAVGMAGRAGAYANGIMVWAVSLAFWALFMAGAFAVGGTAAGRAGAQGAQAAASGAALAGLASILGLVGALIGSAMGAATVERRAAAVARRPAEAYREERAYEAGRGEARPEEPLHH
jgi:hypothetical protein